MKLAVAGKGGAGKTTVSGTIARELARSGQTVLALDADVNPMLGISLGVGPGGDGASGGDSPVSAGGRDRSRRVGGRARRAVRADALTGSPGRHLTSGRDRFGMRLLRRHARRPPERNSMARTARSYAISRPASGR